MLRQYKLRNYNFRLILWVVVLSVLGILVIGSANESYQLRQAWGLAGGLVLMVIVSLFDFTWVLNFYWLIYLAATALLVSVLFFGDMGGGATRWIIIGGLRFQPSDIAKIMLILFFAKFYEVREDRVSHVRVILFSLALIGLQLYLIGREPDLSTTIVTALVFCAIFFMAGLSYKIICGILVVSIPVAVLVVSLLMQPDQKLIGEYQMTRVYAWLWPEEYPQDAYQQQNSIKAIGSGQLYGKGLNNDDVDSVKNGNFIPEPQTDFIFAVVGEELGFIGCCAVLLLEFLIAFECLMTGRRAKSLSGTLICSGMAALVLFQSFVNISATTGVIPNTGITLPFMSYGLTSLISFCVGIGFVLNVGLQNRKY